MKRLADQGKKPTHRGYLAVCRYCGLVVVHAASTGKPFHMHAASRLCRELAADRLADEKALALRARVTPHDA